MAGLGSQALSRVSGVRKGCLQWNGGWATSEYLSGDAAEPIHLPVVLSSFSFSSVCLAKGWGLGAPSQASAPLTCPPTPVREKAWGSARTSFATLCCHI